MRLLLSSSVGVLLIFVYLSLTPLVWEGREQVRSKIPAGYVIPSKFSRVLAVGHQGLLSDFLFLKMATFVGGRVGAKERFDEEDWQFVVRSIDVITDLDPYFEDPYVVAEGLLAWDAGKPQEANRLLRKGMQYRTSDWRLPFYIGFNYFYFLENYEEASEYIRSASQIPGSPYFLSTLAARLAYYAGKSKTALLFLQEMLVEADDPLLRNSLQLRLTALERAVVIEEALDKYKAEFGKAPGKLQELVSQGYLQEMPEEPYGGEWILLKNGRIFSTSKFTSRENE